MPDPLVVPGAPGVPGAETPGQEPALFSRHVTTPAAVTSHPYRPGADPARPDPSATWEVGAVALSVEVLRLGSDYLSGVLFGLRVNGKVERTSWEYPDADLSDVTERLMSRWRSGSE